MILSSPDQESKSSFSVSWSYWLRWNIDLLHFHAVYCASFSWLRQQPGKFETDYFNHYYQSSNIMHKVVSRDWHHAINQSYSLHRLVNLLISRKLSMIVIPYLPLSCRDSWESLSKNFQEVFTPQQVTSGLTDHRHQQHQLNQHQQPLLDKLYFYVKV